MRLVEAMVYAACPPGRWGLAGSWTACEDPVRCLQLQVERAQALQGMGACTLWTLCHILIMIKMALLMRIGASSSPKNPKTMMQTPVAGCYDPKQTAFARFQV